MDIADILNRCGPVSPQCIEAVRKLSIPYHADKGEIIVRQEEICGDIYFFGSGTLRIALRKGQKEDTLCFGGAGDTFLSFHSYYNREPSRFMVTALENVEGWRLPIDRFRYLEKQFPDLIMWMRNLLVEQMYSFEGLYYNFSMSDAQERMESFWQSTPQALRNISPNNLSKIVPLKFIAQYLGITQQTLSRLRRIIVKKSYHKN